MLVLTYGVAAHTALRSSTPRARRPGRGGRCRARSSTLRRAGVADAMGNVAVFGVLWATGTTRESAPAARRVVGAQSPGPGDQERSSGQAALADERQRIARELHDVVAHSVSVMVLQAGAARQYLDLRPGQSPATAAGRRGRRSCRHSRNSIGCCTCCAATTRSSGPLAGLDQSTNSSSRCRRAGVEVRIAFSGNAAALAPGLDLTAYRVLQEALTNVLKHAPSAHPRVEVVYTERELMLSRRRRGRHAAASARRLGRPRADRDARARPAVRRTPGRRTQRGRAGSPSAPGSPWSPRRQAGVNARLRVVVADDQALVRSGIRLILEAQPDLEVVGEASGRCRGRAARPASTAPDVVLMDIQMPRMDGIVATGRVCALPGRAPRVLVLTTFDQDDHLYDAVRAGATGFLLKSAPPEQLVAAVRVAASGETLLAPSITRRLLDEFTRRPPPGTFGPAGDHDTDRPGA